MLALAAYDKANPRPVASKFRHLLKQGQRTEAAAKAAQEAAKGAEIASLDAKEASEKVVDILMGDPSRPGMSVRDALRANRAAKSALVSESEKLRQRLKEEEQSKAEDRDARVAAKAAKMMESGKGPAKALKLLASGSKAKDSDKMKVLPIGASQTRLGQQLGATAVACGSRDTDKPAAEKDASPSSCPVAASEYVQEDRKLKDARKRTASAAKDARKEKLAKNAASSVASDASTVISAMTKAEITKGHRAHLDWATGFVKRAVDAGAGVRVILSDAVNTGLAANPAPYPTFNGKSLAYKLACLIAVSPDSLKKFKTDMTNVDGNVSDGNVSDGNVSDGGSVIDETDID